MPLATDRETTTCRWLDDDNRLLFATSFDGSSDAYMEDFASKPLLLSTRWSGRCKATTGSDVAILKGFILGAQVTTGRTPQLSGDVKEMSKADQTNAELRQLLDNPDAAEALQHPALKPLLDE